MNLTRTIPSRRLHITHAKTGDAVIRDFLDALVTHQDDVLVTAGGDTLASIRYETYQPIAMIRKVASRRLHRTIKV
jgi:hypothetical protein